jgi:hypothetical protein
MISSSPASMTRTAPSAGVGRPARDLSDPLGESCRRAITTLADEPALTAEAVPTGPWCPNLRRP